MTFMHMGMDRPAMSGAVAGPGVRFNFWTSMADLVRLVLRSRARGLKTRLGVALTLVLIGKWTGVPFRTFLQRIGQRAKEKSEEKWTTLLSLIAYPVYEFGSGRGALFVPEMDMEAFPPLAREAHGGPLSSDTPASRSATGSAQ